ncbi:MAG TPA: protein kinase [Candidatus Acidoferrum sp.]|nr:protein kinase [Candidatus Acidoferrum sp.]
MTLHAGGRLGPYEIVSPLGSGGMGEVYRARDLRLGREVAIKVLPEALAGDAERMVRLNREAQLLASLNHPAIAAVYGFEDSAAHALIMELVEGPTLADRIKSGLIPLDEALPIAQRICEAVEYAHERGVVHRDLKPSNIKCANDGTVKILDFGLAKALENGISSMDISSSPTISRMATQAGIILGTAAYMSPEQAKGKTVDRRTDIWSFGCVLYEMLAGAKAFSGETITDTLAAVLKNEPDWLRLPLTTPASIRVLLQRCLRKDVRQRLQAIGDARIAIEETLADEPAAATMPAAPMRSSRRAIPFAVGLLALLIGGVAVWIFKPSPRPVPEPVTRFTITLPRGQNLAVDAGPCLAFSPDGSQLAYVAISSGSTTPQIYVRAMDTQDTKPLPGTEGAISPFFSPDGRWLGFFVNGKLKKISVKGGEARTVADAGVTNLGASWSSQQTIAFTPYSSTLQEVSDSGGTSKPLTRFEPGESMHSWPEFLPGGKAILFGVVSSTPTGIAALSLRSHDRVDLIRGEEAYMPRYAPSGQLIYAEAGNLMAAPFDLLHLEIKGPSVPVVENVLQSSASADAQYTISAGGSLAYISGAPTNSSSQMVWVSRNGTEQAIGAPPRVYNQPRLSPDGRRIAVDVVKSDENMQVWIYDLSRETFSPFTFDGVNRHAVWTPDGKRIAFASNRDGPIQIFWKYADGTGTLERLTTVSDAATPDLLPIPYSWTPDGRVLAFVKLWPTKASEFWLLNVSDRTARRFMTSHVADGGPQISPDGHWLAYASDESGRREIYVEGFPVQGGKWQVSAEGGNEPQWSRNGRELFYREGNKMMAADITAQAGLIVGKPRELFEGNYLPVSSGYVRAQYDISPNGDRFLMLKAAGQKDAGPTQINVVLNWTEELTRVVPAGSK